MVVTLSTLGGPRRGLVEVADTDDPQSVKNLVKVGTDLMDQGYKIFASSGKPGTETLVKDKDSLDESMHTMPVHEAVPQIAGG